MTKPVIVRILVCLAAWSMSAWADGGASPDDRTVVRDEEPVLRSLADRGPVDLHGSVRATVRHHEYGDFPSYLEDDRRWTIADGPELELRLDVRPDRHSLFWSGVVLKTALPGGMLPNFVSEEADEGWRENAGHHHSDQAGNLENILLFQDVNAGMRLFLGSTSLWARMGGILWVQTSPLTLWTADTRHFAWDYLPFEDEKSVGRYYHDRVIRGSEEGAASDKWSKRAMQGIDIEAVSLPLDLHANWTFGQFGVPDFFEREVPAFDNITDRWMLGGRLSWKGGGTDFEPAFNCVGVWYDDDIARGGALASRFGIAPGDTGSQAGFYKQWYVYSLDAQTSLTAGVSMHTELALSRLDTHTVAFGTPHRPVSVKRGGVRPAFFGTLRTPRPAPLEVEVACIDKGFYSPTSQVLPADLMFPVGAHSYGMAKMLNGASYTSNMAGARLSFMPEGPAGRLKLSYGQHAQLNPGRDIVHFPHRLNGSDYQQSLQSSWSRWTSRPVDVALRGEYRKRLGDESYRYETEQTPGIDAGAIRGEYLTAFESFVPYESAVQADAALNCTTSIATRSPFVPVNRKWTHELKCDAALDVSSLLGLDRSLLLDSYVAINGIAARPVALRFDERGMLLWGFHSRIEPSIALTGKLHVLLLAGYENWRSEMAFMEVTTTSEGPRRSTRVPIDYRDYALGCGFDCDVARRAGLHVRYKWMAHDDVYYGENGWTAFLVSGTIKCWF